jgi:hypothetical protein
VATEITGMINDLINIQPSINRDSTFGYFCSQPQASGKRNRVGTEASGRMRCVTLCPQLLSTIIYVVKCLAILSGFTFSRAGRMFDRN